VRSPLMAYWRSVSVGRLRARTASVGLSVGDHDGGVV
jgi:hypothetical protein